MEGKWFSTEDKLPEIGKEVLCFYEIDDLDYYVCGRIESITERKTATSAGVWSSRTEVEWLDSNNDCIVPAFWMELPPPPNSTK